MFSIGKIITLTFIIMIVIWLFRVFKTIGNMSNNTQKNQTADDNSIIQLKKGKDGKYR